MSSVILHAHPINVKSTLLPTETLNENSIEVKGTRQKGLDDVVDTSPPRKNVVVRGCVATFTKKKQDYVVNKKLKKISDDNLNAASKLTTYATQKGKVVSTQNNLV
jgi:hypothetical protein